MEWKIEKGIGGWYITVGNRPVNKDGVPAIKGVKQWQRLSSATRFGLKVFGCKATP